MADIPTIEPSTVVAGDTLKWLKSLPDYPASAGWALTYTFVNAGGRYTVSAVAQGSDHLVTVSAATSSIWLAGAYEWRGQVSKAGEIFTVASGRLVVEPAFGSAIDARSQARKQLEAVEAVLEGRAGSAVSDYEIAGRRLKYIPIPELLTLRDRLRMDVAREDAVTRARAGLPPRGRIEVRFGR